MLVWLRRLGAALLVLLLLAHAHSPALSAGPTGGEFRTLLEVEHVVRPAGEPGVAERVDALFRVHGTHGRPLAAASLALSTLLWSPAQRGVLPLRAENLALLVLTAWAAGAFVRRLLWPWLGTDQARAAGRATSLLVALQPLQTAAVATVGARGDLLALLFGATSAAIFLKSRQDRVYSLTVVAALLALVAGLCSRLALGLPFVLAAAEFAASRRYRPTALRLRTAGTTLVVFGACAALGLLVWNVQTGFSVAPAGSSTGAPASLAHGLGISVERLGVVVLPVGSAAVGAIGIGAAGALLLLALQPALAAARAAPRLWGWLLLSWAAGLVVAELCSTSVRVTNEDLTAAATLLPSTTALSIGLAISATALSGLRRLVLPIVLAGGWAVLAHANAGAWVEAGRTVASFRADVAAAQQLWGYDRELIAVDPPGRTAGIDALEGALPWMVDPLFSGRSSSGGGPNARAISLGGMRMLSRQPEYLELRAQPVIVLFPMSALESGQGAEPRAQAERRESALLRPPAPASGPRSWFREGRSGRIDFETSEIEALAVEAAPESDTTAPPRVAWEASHLRLGELSEAGMRGVWTARGEAPEAVFDLSHSLAWILGGRVRQLWSPASGGWSRIEEARLLGALPSPGALDPRGEDDDWLFDGPAETFRGRGLWIVSLLDLGAWGWVDLPAERRPGGGLLVPGAAVHVERLLASGGGPLVWSLERRVEGLPVQRASGRRVAAP